MASTPKGIVRLDDGTFWIGDENGPSMAHFSAEGRHDRAPCAARHRRRLRRAHATRWSARCPRSWPSARPTAASRAWRSRPTSASSISSCRTRWPIRTRQRSGRRATSACSRSSARRMKVAGEYVYVMDDPRSFRRDPSDAEQRSAHQRTDGGRARPADRAGAHRADHQAARNRARRRDRHFWQQVGRRGDEADAWSRATWRPPASRRSRRRCGSTPPTSPRSSARPKAWRCSATAALAIINDDDFGISGGRTQIVVVRGTGIARR